MSTPERLNWSSALQQLQAEGRGHVLITVITSRGSTPRDTGTKMVVTADDCFDTIGGGHLEFEAIAEARRLLLEPVSTQELKHYSLGATLGQCCGGDTSLLFEYFAPQGIPLMLFGAGHVGKALASILAALPIRVRWIDSREEQFPAQPLAGIETVLTDDPVAEIESAPAGGYVVVMTHNHSLDYDICEAALKRGDQRFVGVIGSQTKSRRFRQRLKHRGFTPEQIETLISPVGVAEVGGKRPMEVAVSIAAQLISLYQAELPQPKTVSGVNWKTLNQLLDTDCDHKVTE